MDLQQERSDSCTADSNKSTSLLTLLLLPSVLVVQTRGGTGLVNDITSVWLQPLLTLSITPVALSASQGNMSAF